MELIFDNKKPILNVGLKQLSGIENSEQEDYFGCKYIFEPSCDECSFNDISKYFEDDFPDEVCTNIGYSSDSYEHVFFVLIGRKDNKILISLTASYMIQSWDGKMNLKHFLPKFKSELNLEYGYEVEFIINYEEEGSFVTLNFSIDLDSSIKKSLSEATVYLESTHNLVLDSFSQDDGFISQFRFPHEYKSVFVQYLTYFGRFLEDLGIKGNLSLRETDGLTYLSFRPESGDIALGNIAAALTSYLSLPDNNNNFLVRPSTELESEIRFQQLASVVDHLKSQLRLSNAILTLKEREISLLENQDNRKSFDTRLATPVIKDYWEPIKGIRITTYKGKFFEINIPELVELFSRSKKK